MSGGLVGRVEQLLELAGKARLPWEVANTERILIFEKGSRDEDAFVADTGPEEDGWALWHANLIVAAVNLVEPLARDRQRLKGIEALTERYAPEGFFRLWEQQPQFTLCRDTGLEARGGNCVAHGGDGCLHQYVQVSALTRAMEAALAAVSE